jgi:co-chaperonin GroES (HSP10)
VIKLSFEPHVIEKDKFFPINEHIIVTDMSFDERVTRGGIVIPNDNRKSEGIRPRWARIYKIGAEYKGDLKEGDWILVSHGRWTRGITVVDETGEKDLRRVDPDEILLVSDERMDDETYSDKV